MKISKHILRNILVKYKIVSSRQIAEHFDKLHKDVLESIREILAAENSASNFFIESTFENRGKQYPMFIMNRDGFTLLAMGFTGKDALQWKLKYIQAFNQMEEELKHPKVNTIPKEKPNKIKEQETEARLRNARVRESNQYLKIAAQIDIPEYKYILQSKAAETLAGTPILPMQEAQRKTYTATEIGGKLDISANKVGKLANANNLKTAEYGKLFYDKSPYSVKEVESWRYYDSIIPVLAKLLGKEVA